MSLPDSDPLPLEPQPPNNQGLPEPEPVQEPVSEPSPLREAAPAGSHVRRRKGRRRVVPWELTQRAAFFGELIHLSSPSFDFFLFSAIAGLVVGAALLLDSPALFFLAAILAPFMSPVLGIGVATAVGNLGFFFRSLIGLVIGGLLVFATGAIAGLVSQSLAGPAYTQALFHTTFSWPDLIVVILGAALTAYLAVGTTQQRPLVSSVALAYELFLPLAAAGFGLVQPIPGLFPEGLILFASNLALSAVIATFVLVFLGVRPLPNGLGWLVSVLLLLVLVGSALLGIGAVVLAGPVLGPVALLPSATPTSVIPPTATITETPQPTSTGTPLPPTSTVTATSTLLPTSTATITLTPSPTPVYGLVNAGDLNGIIIRPEPGSLLIVTTLLNGSVIEILPEVVSRNNSFWMHVRSPDGKEGWVQAGLIVTATPRPR